MSRAFLAFHQEMPELQSVTSCNSGSGRVTAVMAGVCDYNIHQAPFLLLWLACRLLIN